MADQPLTDEALRQALVHGPRPVYVELVEYNPAWPVRFQRHADLLRAVLGERARLVEHIGSTSVPGLAAKNVIDILVGIEDPEDEAAYVPDLEAIGYQMRVRELQHRCLRGHEPDEPVNLHCYPTTHPEIPKYLLFREHLRCNAADRDLYEATKRALAGREWPDMNYYAEAKGEVIRAILARARQGGRANAAATEPSPATPTTVALVRPSPARSPRA